MKFSNWFAKATEETKVADSIDIGGLLKVAENFVGEVISNASPERSRLIELAVKNGKLTLSIEIAPTPGVRILVDPGEPVFIDF